MVAKTPIKERRASMSLNSNKVRETLKKVDKCMARLQELQYTVTGGSKVVSGKSLKSEKYESVLQNQSQMQTGNSQDEMEHSSSEIPNWEISRIYKQRLETNFITSNAIRRNSS